MIQNKKKDHILIFINNIAASLLMVSQLKKKKIDHNRVTIIIEKRVFKKKEKVDNKILDENVKFIKNIFVFCGYKKIFFYNRPKNIQFFNLKNIFFFLKFKKINKIHKKNLFEFLERKKLNISSIKNVWFSNDLLSKIFLTKNNYRKTYFFHGVGDIMNLKKKFFFLNFLSFVKYKINIIFYNLCPVYFDKNITFYNFFSKEYNKILFNIPNNVSLKFLKNIIFKISKKYKKIKFKKKIILITDNIFLHNLDQKNLKKFSRLYASHFIKFLNINKIKNENFLFLLKWKSTAKKKYKEILKKEFKKLKIDLKDLDEFTGNFIPLEFLLSNLKPTYLISYYSTINFFVKYLFPRIKIINTEKIHNLVRREYLDYHKQNNLNEILKNSEIVKKLVKVPYSIKI